MATMPPVALGAILFLTFLVVLLLRRSFEKYFVLTAVETAQPRRQFAIDLSLCLLAGVLGNAANMISFGFPLYSAMPLMIGCLIAGFFIALDTALARERRLIQEAIARNNVLPPPARLYSMTKKFSLVALSVTIFISLVFTLVFSRDIVWLSQIERNEAALYQAQVSVAYEVGFIMVVVLAMVVNLIISYSRNLRFLFQNETRILERVTHGDLSKKVPVATNDEFGIIAGHTNSMIDGLRHRTELMTSLKLAEEVQQNLLPQQPPDFAGADIAGTSIYCDETGGDYYDFISIGDNDDHKIGVAIGDVSGHGISSALLMATVRSSLRQRASLTADIATIISDVNRQLAHDVEDSGQFMTLFFLALDTATKQLEWVRAGHDPGIVYDPDSDAFSELGGAGIALGVDAEWNYAGHKKTDLTTGQIIFLSTDGIWEACNQEGEMLGKAPILDAIRQNATSDAAQIINAVFDLLEEFTAGTNIEDDITAVVLKIRYDATI